MADNSTSRHIEVSRDRHGPRLPEELVDPWREVYLHETKPYGCVFGVVSELR